MKLVTTRGPLVVLVVASLFAVSQLSGVEPAAKKPAAKASAPQAPTTKTPGVTPPPAKKVTTVANAAAQPNTAADNPPQGVGPLDWGQWGGSSLRNNVPKGKDIPVEWNIGAFDPKTGEWSKAEAENVRWVASLGSQSYGNPVVANGKVYIGTNNGAGYLKRYPATIDLGVLLAFNEADGKFLWQHSNEKLPTGRVHDWPLQGVCAAPLVEGDRLWYVTNRGEIVCLDADGFHDNKDNGPVTKDLGRLFDVTRNDDAAKDKLGPITAGLKAGKVEPALADEFQGRRPAAARESDDRAGQGEL